jgi:hypothetical protein
MDSRICMAIRLIQGFAWLFDLVRAVNDRSTHYVLIIHCPIQPRDKISMSSRG